ncbi:MAG TPA: 2-oxo-hepta-3-ene-1,7-dioic acid hydratase [Ilumatobacteraceae bacterium]|nr:2-oxo-hepta-3-ene-1,7-dioic acid hydratase [Ilumatobacteraceae bacterium]
MATTLDPEQIAEIAARHEHARTTRRLIKRITLDHPDMTLDDAYACQRAWTELQLANGATVRGHKIGLTSRAMQQAMKIDEPDFGVLFDYMFFESGATLTAADYLDPKIEVELAFVLRRPLGGPDVTVDDVNAATDHIVPALELIDARSHRIDPDDGVARGVRDTIADNAADAGVVIGGRQVAPGEVDLRWVPAILKRNGVVEETGVAAAVLDDPVMGIVWLARRLAGYGITLEAGETILTGSFTRPVDCRAGDHFEVDYAGLGVITVDFV